MPKQLVIALHKLTSYQFSPDLAIERFADKAILFVAEWDALITVNRGGADLFESATLEFADHAFGRAEAAAWFESTFDLPSEDVQLKVLSLLTFAVRHGIVVKQSE